MGNLVFQATLGGQVNLVGPNTASTYNINVPTVNGNMVTTGDTGTVTNTMCATSVYTAPGTIGSGTPNTGAFTTLSASGVATISAGSASAPALTTSGDTNTGMLFPAADTIAWTTGGSERLRLDSSGNLGLGVTPSAWSSLRGLQVGTGSLSNNLSGDWTVVGSNAYYDGSTWRYVASATASRYQIFAGAHSWSTASSGTAGNAITFTQAMTLDASGNLGVGTTSPANKIHVVGSAASNVLRAQASSSGDGIVLRPNAAGSGGDLFSVNDAQTAYTPLNIYGSYIALGANGTESARIDSSGNLLVGTTSASARLSVSGSGSYAASIENSTTNNNVLLVAGTASSNAQNYIVFAKSGTATGSINYNGTTVFYSTFSDYRLKNITSDLIGYKERVMSLQPKQGTWISNGSEFRGFLAHEFQNSYSSSVMGEKDAVDENGNPVMQAMQAGSAEVIADLVALLQEQQAIIEQLQADVAALKG